MTDLGGKQWLVLQLGSGLMNQRKYFKTAIINGEQVQSYIDMDAACIAMQKSKANRLRIKYDDSTRDEFIGFGFGRVNSLRSFKTTIIIDKVTLR